MKKLICIICPNSCTLEIDEKTLEVAGGKCPRGAVFVKSEITRPMRTVTSTVRTVFAEMPAAPVKTDGEIEKNLIPALMGALSGVLVRERLKMGDIILADAAQSGVNVVLCCDIE